MQINFANQLDAYKSLCTNLSNYITSDWFLFRCSNYAFRAGISRWLSMLWLKFILSMKWPFLALAIFHCRLFRIQFQKCTAHNFPLPSWICHWTSAETTKLANFSTPCPFWKAENNGNSLSWNNRQWKKTKPMKNTPLAMQYV